MTAAEVLMARGRAEGKAEGRAEGKAEGRAEGKAEGRAEGKAEVVLRLVRLKYGEVPDAIRERISKASSDELDLFAERVVSVASLHELAEPRTE